MTNQKKGLNPAHARKRARRYALQALYQWQLSGQNLKDIEAQYSAEKDMPKADIEYFRELLHKIPACTDELDAEYAGLADRKIEEIDPIELAALRIASYELKNHFEIPYKVVINEAVQLTKTFGASESHKYVNGILDKLAQKLRALEINS